MISHNNGERSQPQCYARGLVCLCLDLETPSVAAAAHPSVLCWIIPTSCQQMSRSSQIWCCCAAEFTSELCAETWVVKDGTATALLKGVRIEGAGEQVGTSSILLPVTVSHSL